MRLSWPELTQNAVSYVLGLRTPLLRQGEVTVFFFSTFLVLFVKASVFCLRRVFIAYYRVCCDKIFSKQPTQSDRFSHRFEALRHIFKTFHEAYTIFLRGQRIGSHIGSVS